MVVDLGWARPGSTIRIPFDTFDGGTGASISMTAFVAADIEVYKDGSAVPRGSDSGYTATTDFDASTGLHLVTIDLSDNTTANFYESGSEYLVAVGGDAQSVTIDAQTVRFWLARFRIGYEGAILNTTIASVTDQNTFTLEDGSADNDAYNGGVIVVDDLATEFQTAQGIVTDYVGSTKTVETTTNMLGFTVAAGDHVAIWPRSDQGFWLSQAVTLSTNNKPDVNVDEWGDVLLATTNPLPDVAAGSAGGVPTDTDANGAVRIVDGTGARELDTSSGTVTTGAISTGAITADAIAANAIDAAAVADDAIDLIWDEVLTVGTHNVGNSAGRRLREMDTTLEADTAQAGSADTITLATGASATDDIYVGTGITIQAGTGAGQARYIIGYNGTTKVATVARPWTTNPSSDSEYVVSADNQIDVLQMGLASAGGATSITLDANASATDNIYNHQFVRVFGGTGKYQVRVITAYNGTTKVATVAPAWDTNPDSTSYYAVLGLTRADITLIEGTDATDQIRDSILSDATTFAGANIDAAVSTRATPAQVNTQVLDVMNTDTFAEPGQGTPGATVSLVDKIGYLYKAWRNRQTQTSSQYSLYNDDATTVDQKATFSDDTTTADRGEVATGP